MRVLVCGSRDFNEHGFLTSVLENMAFGHHEDDMLIEGEAPGADTLAREWAERRDILVNKFPALWEKYGKRAGYVRNAEMLDKGKPDIVVAFVNKPLAESRGTAMMVKLAREAGVETLVIEHVVPQ